MIEIIWKIIGLCFSMVSFLPLLDSKHWFFRVFDFIRLQLTVVLLFLLLIAPFVLEFDSTIEIIIVLAVIVAIVYHLEIILPYFPRTPANTKKIKDEVVAISVNVKQENQQFDRLIEIVKKIKPDILLTLETNKIWETRLKEIEEYYTTIIRVPKENRYGMHLYSKLDIKKHKIHYLISKEHPSIEALMVINNYEFNFWCIHPPPPSPTEKTTSKQKDAELLKVAQMINRSAPPTIITGDFNNVTWSKISKLFSRVSKLKDARTHRGFFPTFPAHLRLFGFPIDLLFHSKSIQIGRIKTLESIGSDHLPILFSFAVRGDCVSNSHINEELSNLVTKTIKKGKMAAQKENE